MPSVQVTGVQVVATYVSDLERAKTFYSEQLGFSEAAPMPPGVLLKAGELSLYLEGGRAPREAASRGQAEVAAVLEVASVKAAAEALEAGGVRIVTPYQEFGPEFGMFQISDPDGNLVEFAGKP